MTLAEFRATGKDVDDISDIAGFYADAPQPGRVYAGNLYIQRKPNDGWHNGRSEQFHLVLANTDWLSDDLADLEEKLWQYGETEHVL